MRQRGAASGRWDGDRAGGRGVDIREGQGVSVARRLPRADAAADDILTRSCVMVMRRGSESTSRGASWCSTSTAQPFVTVSSARFIPSRVEEEEEEEKEEVVVVELYNWNL